MRYNEILAEYLSEKRFFTRLERLYVSFTTPLSKAHISELEELDKIRTTGMRKAEKQCRKLRMGNVKWSPKLQQARDRISYYKLTLSRRRGCKVGARVLQTLSRKLNENNLKLTNNELEKCLETANQDYLKVKKDHEKERKSFLEDLAEALEANGKGKKSKQIRHLQRM